jgi:hypothetical protein
MPLDKQESDKGMLPSQWERLFRMANVEVEALDKAKSHRSRATLLGNFLARNLDRMVPIEVDGRPGKARLLAEDAGQRQKRYYFEICWDGDGPPGLRDGPGPDDQSRTSTQGNAADPPRRRRRAKERISQPVSAAGNATHPGRSGTGNEEDWS